MKQEKKRKHNNFSRSCYTCNNCEYIGEGGYMCGVNHKILIEDWCPTEDFNSCKGKRFEQK